MASAAARSREAGSALLSIGQVLARLKPDFPDLTPSKIRFLEDQGLISPSRTESGYRKFSASDVERITQILTMQRDRYLPLKVIRDYLADSDAGLSPLLPGSSSSSILDSHRYTRDELLRLSGASSQLLSDAVSAGLIAAGEMHREDSLNVLTALAQLRMRGIEPRHLRTVRTAVEREIGLIASAVAPTRARRDATSTAKTADTVREISRQLDVVRGTLARVALDRLIP